MNLDEENPETLPTLLLPGGVLPLLYHVVSDRALAHVRHLFSYKSRAAFLRDLDYISAAFRPLNHDEAARRLTGPEIYPISRVLITFDDGLVECFTTVRPLLLERALPCVFFVVADFIDNRRLFYRHKVSLCIDQFLGFDAAKRRKVLAELRRTFSTDIHDFASFAIWLKRFQIHQEHDIDAACEILGVDVDGFLENVAPYLTSEQLRILASEGFTIGAHSRTHARFEFLDKGTIEREIVESCEWVKALTGQERVPFAFPFSARGVDREHIARVMSGRPDIGPLYDAEGSMRSHRIIHDRVCCDEPPLAAEQSNIRSRLAHITRRLGGPGQSS